MLSLRGMDSGKLRWGCRPKDNTFTNRLAWFLDDLFEFSSFLGVQILLKTKDPRVFGIDD